VLSGLAHEGRREDMLEYLGNMVQRSEEARLMHFAANPVLDALLSHYATKMESAKLRFTAQIDISDDERTDIYDLCVLLGNLLENALLAAQKSPEGAGFVNLEMRYSEGQLVLRVKNSFDGVVEKSAAGGLKSLRQGGGVGTRSIRAVAQKYGGVYENEWDDSVFTAYVLLSA
jgi:sensor histidine kinase regulating citrate/malate metabolism